MNKKWKLFAILLGAALIVSGTFVGSNVMVVEASGDTEISTNTESDIVDTSDEVTTDDSSVNEEVVDGEVADDESATSDDSLTKDDIMYYLLGLETFDEDKMASADYNGDGIVNLQDYMDMERVDAYGDEYVTIMNDRVASQQEESEVPEDGADEEVADEESTGDNTEDGNQEIENDNTEDGQESSDSEDEPEDATVDNTSRTIYLDVLESGWTKAFIYSWTGGEKLTEMTLVEGQDGVFTAELPEGVEEFLFINNNEQQWDNGNQSVNVTYDADNTLYSLSNFSGGKYYGEWSAAEF